VVARLARYLVNGNNANPLGERTLIRFRQYGMLSILSEIQPSQMDSTAPTMGTFVNTLDSIVIYLKYIELPILLGMVTSAKIEPKAF
jgi:hypothetical protein